MTEVEQLQKKIIELLTAENERLKLEVAKLQAANKPLDWTTVPKIEWWPNTATKPPTDWVVISGGNLPSTTTITVPASNETPVVRCEGCVVCKNAQK